MSKWLHLSISTVLKRRIFEFVQNVFFGFFFHSGNQQPRSAIYLNSIAVGLERFGKNIVVGCMDSTLHCYTTKVCR